MTKNPDQICLTLHDAGLNPANTATGKQLFQLFHECTWMQMTHQFVTVKQVRLIIHLNVTMQTVRLWFVLKQEKNAFLLM